MKDRQKHVLCGRSFAGFSSYCENPFDKEVGDTNRCFCLHQKRNGKEIVADLF